MAARSAGESGGGAASVKASSEALRGSVASSNGEFAQFGTIRAACYVTAVRVVGVSWWRGSVVVA